MTDDRYEDRDVDPISSLAATLAALDVHARQDAKTLRRNETNRLNLLYVHAVAAIVIAPLFAASAPALTGPIWALLRYVPGFPYTLAVWVGVAGLVLLPAAILRARRVEMVALALLSSWYTAITIGFFVPTAQWVYAATPAIFAGEELPPARPGLYAWALYAHLSVIMRVHLLTLWRMTKEDRAAHANRNLNQL